MAAVLAATAVLLALGSLRGATEVTVAADPVIADPALHTGEVAVPVVLSSAAVARTLDAGDVLDVVSRSGTDEGAASGVVVAHRARVLEVPDSSSGFGSSGAAVVVLAVRESEAVRVSALSVDGPLSIVIRSMADPR